MRSPTVHSSRRAIRGFNVAWLALLLAGCGLFGPEIEVKLPTPNPNPTERYQVTVEVTHAPGEFVSAEGLVRFQMTDDTRSCIPRAEITGAPLAPYAGLQMPFVLTKTSPTRFEGIATIDQFIPNDDYGLGVCDWQPIGISAILFNGINRHDVGTQISLPGSAFSAGDDKYLIADGLYRGRRAFHKGIFERTKLTETSPEPKRGDPPVLLSGTYEDGRLPIRSEYFERYYFITITAERLTASKEDTP